MKNRLVCICSVLALVLSLGSMVAVAQKSSAIKIPFAFWIGDQQLQAGQYSFKPNENMNALVVHNVDKNQSVNVPVLTRLSPRPERSVQLVFDKADDKNFLSEVYFPGMDGFHLKGAPGKHTHTKLEAK
jgi:hypothetical protein